MAFFNLWSSERLSFSLSIVAVISAAITSYYQFFYYSTNVKYVWTSDGSNYAQCEGTTFDDSLALQITFMNEGSTPVSILKSRLYLLNPRTKNGQGNLEKSTIWGRKNPGVIYQDDLKENFYLEPKSINTLTFHTKVDSTSLMRLINAAPSATDSTWSDLEMGVTLLLVDPYGNFSAAAISLAHPIYELDGVCAAVSLDLERGSIPPFVAWEALLTIDAECQEKIRVLDDQVKN